MQLCDELIPPCKICKKQWQRKDVENWVYHTSVGVVCRSHIGVIEWHDNLIRKANKELEKLAQTY